LPYCCKGADAARIPPDVPAHLVQTFTDAEWETSNFAAPADLQWFRGAKYGMFIHFGLSTHEKANLSWGSCHTRKPPDVGAGPVPDDVWQRWPASMKLEKFDARSWVATAQAAGFKYVVVVAKHHDGFHMWDTAYSEFKITNTPFGRDYLKELACACHEEGLPFGVYYSQRDWRHPDYMPVDPAKVDGDLKHWTLKPGETTPLGERHGKYIEYQFNVCRELCARYGKLGVFWWDAAWWGGMFTAEMWDGERLTREVRRLQPGILMNNRCSVPGDFDTPEQRLGFYQDWRPWESCVCLERGWSYTGAAPKPRDEIIRMIVCNACRDGNLLLSWGPKWDGEFDAAQQARLFEVSDWLKRNGEAIFDTRGGPWKPSPSCGSVRKGKTVYLHVLAGAGDTIRLPEIPGRRIVSARALNGEGVAFEQGKGEISIGVPRARQTPPVTIIELTMDHSVDETASVETSGNEG